ncbi:hypothetical protein [Pseudoxanthomonas wuyuanensis]|uniref:hypothetical protein n=1 Tax=Pseudoxanthomonas wuyuanensis TaxID=1073196 RepID=UPI001596CF89|nr:hypothetical protein [Pseudoxanthomonas wuyuanensis]
MSLVSVAWPNAEPEATMMASLLYAHGIPFFVRDAEPGETPHPARGSEHSRVVLVSEKDVAFTIRLLSELVQFEGATENENPVSPASRE